VTVKAYVDRVDIVHLNVIVATHIRCYSHRDQVLNPLHYLATLERRPAALDHSNVYRNWTLPPVFLLLRERLEERHGARAGVRHYVRVLQLLNVLIDFIDDETERPPLGDGFRVEAAVVEWESDNVLVVPAGALFRANADWAVFVARASRAQLTPIRIGHRNDDQAEIVGGLDAGDKVILYPGDRVADGDAIEERTL
jgi:hypothetical protein